VIAVKALLDNGLVVFDLERRTFAGLSHEGDYWHLIRPGRPDDLRVVNGRDGVGELACSCAGGQLKGRCWRLAQAVEFERALAEQRAWGLEPVPA
jgi:hypothetical protein